MAQGIADVKEKLYLFSRENYWSYLFCFPLFVHEAESYETSFFLMAGMSSVTFLLFFLLFKYVEIRHDKNEFGVKSAKLVKAKEENVNVIE